MLQLLKNNNPFTVLILFIFALVVKIQILIHPILPLPIPKHLMYNFVLTTLSFIFKQNAFVYCLFSVILIFIQALYLNNITVRHKLFHRFTFVPAFVFVLLSTYAPHFLPFNETLIINFLLLGSLDIMFGFSQTNQPRKLIFNASMLLSLAVFFQFTMLAFFLLLVVGMVLFRSFNAGEWSVALMGYLTPVYFIACILFLADNLAFFTTLRHLDFSLSMENKPNLYQIISFSGITLLLISGMYAMQINIAMSSIYIRRDWTAIIFYFILSLIVGFVTDFTIKSAWLITVPPMSFIISHVLLLEKNKRLSNFIFYLSLLLLVFNIWVNK